MRVDSLFIIQQYSEILLPYHAQKTAETFVSDEFNSTEELFCGIAKSRSTAQVQLRRRRGTTPSENHCISLVNTVGCVDQENLLAGGLLMKSKTVMFVSILLVTFCSSCATQSNQQNSVNSNSATTAKSETRSVPLMSTANTATANAATSAHSAERDVKGELLREGETIAIGTPGKVEFVDEAEANSTKALRTWTWCCNSKGGDHSDPGWDRCGKYHTFNSHQPCYNHDRRHKNDNPSHDSGCR